MVASHRPVLVVEEQHHVRLVGQRGVAPHVVDPHPLRVDPLGVGGDHGQQGHRLAHGQLLELLDTPADLLLLALRVGIDGHLLQVVDDHHQRPGPGTGPGQARDRLHRGPRPRLDQEQPLLVLGQPLQHRLRRPQLGQQLPDPAPALASTVGPAEQVPQVANADRLLRAGQGALHGDQPLEQELLRVLVAHVQRPPMPSRRHVPRHLQRPGALANPLRPTHQEQLAHPKPTVQVRVERAEPRRNASQPVGPTRPHVPVELLQHPTQADYPMPMHARLPRCRHPYPLQAASAAPGPPRNSPPPTHP